MRSKHTREKAHSMILLLSVGMCKKWEALLLFGTVTTRELASNELRNLDTTPETQARVESYQSLDTTPKRSCRFSVVAWRRRHFRVSDHALLITHQHRDDGVTFVTLDPNQPWLV